MKLLLSICLAILAISHSKEIGTRNFKGFQVLTVEVTSSAQFEVLKTLYESDEYDFWTTPRKLGATDIMASPQQLSVLTQTFKSNDMKYVVKIQDVEK